MTFSHQLIVDDAGLADLAAALATTHELALDTESNSMFAYRERLCLVQLAIPTPNQANPRLFVIDPLAFPSAAAALAPLVQWLVDSENRVLLHGGEYDVAILRRELGIAPARIFDTQAAAQMLGLEKTGYAALVEIFLDEALAKSHQQHDWKRRPIPTRAVQYALADVVWLLPLAARLEAIVVEADLVEEVALACEAVADARPHAPRDAGEAFWRVVAAGNPDALDQHDLARLFLLFGWRERLAAARDQPPARLVPNEVMHRLATRPPATANDLQGIGLARDIVMTVGPDLVALLATTAEALPAVPEKPRSPRPAPVVRKRETALKTWREAEARRRGVALPVVLPSRALAHLATHGVDGLATTPQLGPKRLATYGAALGALLARSG